MSGFSGINQFGSLTTQNGTRVDYKYLLEKYDADGNGEISKDEFNTAIKEEKLDKVELSSVNTNGDDTIDENEMGVYEQKYKMQEAVNAMSAQITKDFSGNVKSKYIAQVTLELTNYITEYANNYQDEVSGMAEAFAKELPTKYTQIKKNILANEPSSFKSKVLDEIVNNLQTGVTTKAEGAETISDTTLIKIGKLLETEANKYIKANPKCTESELKAHLEAFINQTDVEKMKSAADIYKANTNSFGPIVDNDELVDLKEYAKDFLTEAVNNGVTVKLGNRNIATTNAITTALKSYTDGNILRKDMETAISGLSTVSKKETIIAQDKIEQAEAAEKNFTNIKGSAYQINAGLLNYSKIDSRYFNGGEIYQRGKGWSGSRDKAYDEGYNILTSDNMKSQIKSQIETMLKEQGITFDKIENIFENVYNQSAQEVLNSDGMITGRGARGCSSKGKAYINVKTMIDNFVTTFNTNITKAVDEMNKSSKDMDTIDIDYSQAGKDENGNAIKDETTGEDLSILYATGKTITTRKHGADYYVSIAEKMVDRMKSQMLKKARAMCSANGVEFDEKAFQSMFDNAKLIAVNAAVTGMDSDGKSFGGVAGTVGKSTGIVGGSTLAAGAGVVMADAIAGSATVGAGISLGASSIAAGAAVSAVPVAGWVATGAIVVGSILSSVIGSGHHSESTLNTKTLLDTFAENFKQNYSNWVETEANKAKKKQ
ncbi:EF-hand domain-containing protein [bacterium]|nr:EF-hand domain-containing protein [bacterium]